MSRRALVLLLFVVALAVALAWWLWPDGGSSGPASVHATGGDAPVVPQGAPGGPSTDGAPSPVLPALRLPPAKVTPSDEPGASHLSGRVVSAATGAGIEGAEVTFSLGGGGALTARAGSGGHFELRVPEAGTWQVAAARAEGHLPFGPEWGRSPLSVSVAPGQRISGLVIALLSAPELAGRVLTESGEPAGGARIRLLIPRPDEAVLFPLQDQFVSDAEGRFRFRAIEDTLVEARHPDHGAARVELGIEALDAKQVTLRLARPPQREGAGAELRGVVKQPDGSGAPGALVYVRSADRAYPTEFGESGGYRVFTGDDGRFELAELVRGRYDVSAFLAGTAPARAFDVAVPGPALTLQLEVGVSLRGVVRAAEGASPSAFGVDVRWRKGPLVQLDYAQRSFVDPQGRYEVEGLRPGGYVVRAFADGFVPAERAVEVALGDREARADLVLERGGRVTGRVLSAGSREPVPDARVRIEGFEAPGAAGTAPRARTDAAGQFSLEAVPSTGVSLFIEAPLHHGQVVAGVRPGPVEVLLTPVPADAGEKKVELAGVGAVLKPREDALVVGQVFPGGGAAEAGLVPGDELVSIDGVPVVELGFQGSVERIRGEPGSTVTLGVRRGGAPPEVSVVVTRRRVSG